MPHVLLKFIQKEKYAEDFLDGKLYMNSLYYYWNEYHAKDISSAQADLFEGTIGLEPVASIEKEFGEYSLIDTVFRAVGYKYCNVCCFYKLEVLVQSVGDKAIIRYDIPDMTAFGRNVLIVQNEMELIRRVGKQAKKEGINYLCGSVRYKKAVKCGKPIDLRNRSSIVLKNDEPMAIGPHHAVRDCFVKNEIYSNQKEWRIALYRGKKDITAYTLDVGNLRDIVKCVSADKLVSTIDQMIPSGKILPSLEEGFVGNIDRKEMQKKYIALGDYKTQMLTIIGK